MARIDIYTMDHCAFCERAKALLKQRGIDFKEIRVAWDDDRMWDDLFKISGMKTMPQVFVNEDGGKRLIGGFNELSELDRRDQLSSLKQK